MRGGLLGAARSRVAQHLKVRATTTKPPAGAGTNRHAYRNAAAPRANARMRSGSGVGGWEGTAVGMGSGAVSPHSRPLSRIRERGVRFGLPAGAKVAGDCLWGRRRLAMPPVRRLRGKPELSVGGGCAPRQPLPRDSARSASPRGPDRPTSPGRPLVIPNAVRDSPTPGCCPEAGASLGSGSPDAARVPGAGRAGRSGRGRCGGRAATRGHPYLVRAWGVCCLAHGACARRPAAGA